MTGLVVVSHSRALATAAVALAAEMVPEGSGLRVEVAAGLDEATFGTDATAIMAAVESADDGAGVVVLMDLGSAVMSAELALEMVDPELAARVILSPAPLVEGLVVAAVVAAGGAAPEVVAAEAAGALVAKQGQLATDPPPSAAAPAPSAAAPVTAEVEITNAQGLHARPAARLAAACGRHDAVVTLRNLTTGAGPVPGDSMVWVATLGAARGHRIEVSASGPDAAAAVAAVEALAADGFGDEE